LIRSWLGWTLLGYYFWFPDNELNIPNPAMDSDGLEFSLSLPSSDKLSSRHSLETKATDRDRSIKVFSTCFWSFVS